MSYRYGTRPSFGIVSNLRSEVDIQWSVKDFLKIVPHTIDSPAFSFIDHTWYLRLVWNNDGKGFIAVSLHPKDPATVPADVTVCVTLGLRRADGTVEAKKTSNRTFEKERQWNECACFWKMCDVRENKEEMLSSGALVVSCSLLQKFEDHHDVMKITDLETLSTKLKDLFLSKSHCDVTIKVRGMEFHAHKPILVARSPVFAAAFEHEMSERETGIILIEDCDPHSFGSFLQYLYTGKIEHASFEDAYNLYITADKYGVKELKSYCVAYMTRNLTVENVCDAVRLCDLYNEADFMAAAQTFFNRNACIIFSTPEWESLMKGNCRLANKLLKEMASKVRIVC